MDFTLPEFAFVDDNCHLGYALEGRTVILHIRTATVIEAIAQDDFKEIHLKDKPYEFTFKNRFGATEKHYLAIHYTFADDQDIPEIYKKCRHWYIAYMDWEDSNIVNEQKTVKN